MIIKTISRKLSDNNMMIYTKAILAILVCACGFSLSVLRAEESLESLRNLEAKVQKVVRMGTNATVSLVSLDSKASGSGVIISKRGLILTAAHVIEGREMMRVVFPDGREVKAKVLGANYTRDAAMVQIVDKGPWPFVEVGNSRKLKVGDFVVAMGHPKGYDPTRRPPVRFGRVMTKGDLDFVTTDCALIGGDSGGPLFNLQGRVVGIHSHIAPNREVNNHEGVSGFLESWNKLLDGKSWGALGGNRRDPDRAVMGLNLKMKEGELLIEEIPPEGPSAKLEFVVGDRLLSVAGKKVEKIEDLANIFADLLPGDRVEVKVQRGGKVFKKKVTLARIGDIYKTQRR